MFLRRNIRCQLLPISLKVHSPFSPPGPSPEAAPRMSSSPLVSRANMDILDELQLIAAQNLERLEVNKYYEVIRELGKGTYGKVDLVIHKIRGEGAGPHRHTSIHRWKRSVP